MQQFSNLLSWCLFTAQHVSGVFAPTIRSSMTAVAASSFTFLSCCVRGQARPRTQHNCHHDTKVKPEAATAVIELLMMGGKTPETCWAVNKLQDNKLENCCIWLVIYLNCTMMHRLINLKLLEVLKCYNFLWMQRRRNCSPAASFANCVLTLYLLKVHPQMFLSILINKKCQILSCDTLVANERYVLH